MKIISKNKTNIFLFVIYFLLGFIFFKHQGILNQDTLFNFGFSNQIYNGHIPYNDFNMLTFPLYPYLMSAFSKNLTTFIFFSSLLQSLIFTHIVSLAKDNIVKILLSLIIVAKILLLPFLDYNICMLYSVIIAFYLLKKYLDNQNPKLLFGVGVLLCIALEFKHSLPGVIIIFLTLFLFFYCIKNKNLKHFLYYAIGGLFPAIILLSIALLNGYLINMIDYTVLGLGEFDALGKEQKILPLFIATVIVLVLFVISIIIKGKIKERIPLFIFMVSICVLLILKDDRCSIFALIYILTLIGLEEENFIKNSIKKAFNPKNVCCTVSVAFYSMLIMALFAMSAKQIININNTEYITTNKYEWIDNNKIYKSSLDFVDDIDTYIKAHPNEKILPVSSFTKLYSLSTNQTFGVFDLLIEGNVGKINHEKMYEIIEEYDLLILAEMKLPMEYSNIYDYIKNNYELYEKIPICDGYGYVYKTNN